MLRRKHPQPIESIDMLRTKGLKRFAEVFTADGERIGAVLRFIHRPIEEVNDEMKLYRSYLETQSIQFAGPVYIPTVYIEDYDPAANRVILAVDLNTVRNEAWNREPDFAARGLGVAEELPH
ncbi:hypothetical protein [Promineifilum sp.]|uniref:hypothetical protein n=1 Tax=Promineifilum sp. TaxID=2664178 RepID=UPI0035B3DEB9